MRAWLLLLTLFVATTGFSQATFTPQTSITADGDGTRAFYNSIERTSLNIVTLAAMVGLLVVVKRILDGKGLGALGSWLGYLILLIMFLGLVRAAAFGDS